MALKDLPEIWEVVLPPGPARDLRGLRPQPRGRAWSRDWRRRGRFPVRRTQLAEPLDDFFFDPSYDNLIGSSRDGGKGWSSISTCGARSPSCRCPACRIWAPASPGTCAGPPRAGDAASEGGGAQRRRPGRLAGDQAHPDARPRLLHARPRGQPLRLDRRLARRREGQGPGPGRAHARDRARRSSPPRARPRATSSSPATAATPSSRVSEPDGALVVYDAATFAVVKRLPMRKPVGKYNVGNKIGRSDGTSH